MNIQATIAGIGTFLSDAFAALDTWFDKSADLLSYKAAGGGWAIDQILEHIQLTNQYLLAEIRQAVNKPLQEAETLDLQTEFLHYTFPEEKLKEVDLDKWFSPIGLEGLGPTGKRLPYRLRQQLKEQLNDCLNQLNRLKTGEGILCRVALSVSGSEELMCLSVFTCWPNMHRDMWYKCRILK